ncbi:MAG: hypothetical protein RIS53_592 [Bacillota bacterium]
MEKNSKLILLFNKLMNPFRSHTTNLFFSIGLTWIYTILVLLITMPLITFSEATTPETWMTILHFALMAPGLIYLIFNISVHFQHISKARFLLFPILVFSIPAWTILVLLGMGATILWFVLFLMPIWLIGIPGSLIFGLILDLSKKRPQA